MTAGETYIVTETPLGWNAPGLFKWEKAQKEQLASEKACSVLLEDKVWLVKAMEHLDESMRGYSLELAGVERARAIFPHSSTSLGYLFVGEESFDMTCEGAYIQVFSKEGREELRIIQGWKDSDKELGIRHRIEVFSNCSGALAAMAYGNILNAMGAPTFYTPPKNSVGFVKGRRPNDQNNAVLPWLFWGGG